MADDPEVHRRGVRASDKGFLSLDWHPYLALLRWTAKQRGKPQYLCRFASRDVY